MSLKAGIWALRLRYGSGGWGMGGAEEEGKKKEKIPHMCESIGHRSLWGRCPKGLINALVKKIRSERGFDCFMFRILN